MRQAQVILVILLLALGLMVGLDYGLAQVRKTQHHQGIPIEGVFTPCYNSPPNMNTTANWVNHTIDILQLSTGTTGLLCLDYGFEGRKPPGYKPTIAISRTNHSGGLFGSFLCAEATGGDEMVNCGGIHLFYQVAQLFPQTGSFAVGVNITAESTDTTGVYWLWYGEPCHITVLYVGQTPSTLPAADVNGPQSCAIGYPAPSVKIAGIMGFKVVTTSF